MMASPDIVPSPEQIDAILAFLPEFERNDFVASRVEIRPGCFPFHVYAEEVEQFLSALYENGFVSRFKWSDWQEEARQYFAQPELLRTADIQVIRKLITLHVRKERFCEGHLSVMIKSGHIAALLRRLKELRTQMV
jgi:hypothetical protein